jgi:histidinol-phosphatase (PHP family)
VEEFCEAALTCHMKAIGFCEHVDLDPRDPSFGWHDYDAYRAAVEEARARYGDRLMVLMGAEVGFIPRVVEAIRSHLETHVYDFVVGSVHAINDGMAGISEEMEALETFARAETLAVYREYFELVREMVVTGLFDVIGHLDLVQRFGVRQLVAPLEWGPFYGVLRRIFEGAVKRQMALEINTSGLRQAPQDTYPPRALLKLYSEVGGELVMIGSDAHHVTQLGAGVPAAVKLARELQLTPVGFRERLPERAL